MTADDCVKIIAGVASAQLATLAALWKLYQSVRANSRHLETLRKARRHGSTVRRSSGGAAGSNR